MTIGQLAKISNINVETIRYYESLKLISKPKSKQNGYRIYTNDYVSRINYIKKAKELGFTLKEIREVLKFDDCVDLYELTNRKLNETQDKIKTYNQLSKKLKHLLKTCPQTGSIKNCSIIKSISK